MTLRTDHLLTLARWLSPSYPVGAFAWSHGLETAVAEGAVRDAATLEDWLDCVLHHGAGRSDTVLLAEAWRAGDPAALARVAEFAAALAPSRERRAETLQQGAAFARTTRAVHAIDLPDMAYPCAVGRAVRLAGMPLAPVAQVFVQAMLSTLVQAAQRLMPLGQTAGQQVLSRLTDRSEGAVAAALRLDLDRIGTAAFAVDIASMRHDALEPRLFRS